MFHVKTVKFLTSTLLSFEAMSKDYYLIINLLIFFLCHLLELESFLFINLFFGNLSLSYLENHHLYNFISS